MKRLIAFFMTTVIAFISFSAAASVNEAYVVSAATVYETPYYYNQMSDNAKTTYKELKAAVLNYDKRVKVRCRLTEKDFEKIAELLILHDPMTFNLKNIEAEKVTGSSITFRLYYRYTEESYNKMVNRYEKETEKILAKLDDDMTTYAKIKVIHDSIISSAEYDIEDKLSDTIYGTLVRKKAKCDGYAKTFAYVCGQAGIRAVTVIGTDIYTEDDSMHMWNKVYYNKRWYNIDVTWDDPVSDMKYNRKYDFFMVGDKDFRKTHTENNLSFEVPEASDTSKTYFKMYKKYAEDFESAKSIMNSELKKAAKNRKTYISVQCATSSVYKSVCNYVLNTDNVCGMLADAEDSSNESLIPDLYSYGFNDDLKTVKLYIFYDNTDLDDYFLSTEKISDDTLKAFKKYGID